MLRALQQWLVVVPLVVALGGHLLLLQTVAWANMLVAYSREASFTEAVRMTFDGEHPCPLCKKIQKTRKQERERETQSAPDTRLELGLPRNRLQPPAPPRMEPIPFAPPKTPLSHGGDEPPTPPPRLV